MPVALISARADQVPASVSHAQPPVRGRRAPAVTPHRAAARGRSKALSYAAKYAAITARRPGERVGAVERQPGQVVDAVHMVVRQRRPAVLPGAAGPASASRTTKPLRREAGAVQVIGGGQAGLPGADHHDVRGVGVHVGYNAPDVTAVPVLDRRADHRRPFRLRPPDLRLR